MNEAMKEKQSDRRIIIPLDILGKGLTPSQVLIASTVRTFSSAPDRGLSACNRKYKGFCSSLNISRATVWTGLKKLQEKGIVQKTSRSSYVFDDGSVEGKYYLRYRDEFRTMEFNIRGEGVRRLRASEALVLSYLYTHCDNEKKALKKIETSFLLIASDLHISLRSAKRAIRVLLRADLIHRAEDEKGINAFMKSVYRIDGRFVRAIGREENRKGAPDDYMARRERVYAQRRAEAERPAEIAQEKAIASAEYCAEVAKENEYMREAAKAEAFGGDVAGFKSLQDLAHSNVRKILRKMGLTPKDLEPQYHCQRCKDTGFLPSGVMCNCVRIE